MSVTGTGNAARFAARPLSGGGTSPLAWTAWGRPFPELDLTGGKSLLVVAPHPDDETLGFGAAAATLQSRGVKVQVVSVTDGDASYPGLPMRGRRKLARSVAPNCQARQVFSDYLHRFLSACPMAKSAPTYADWPNYSPHCSPKRLAHGVPPPGAATGIPTMKPSERRRRSRPTARATDWLNTRCGCGTGPTRTTMRCPGNVRRVSHPTGSASSASGEPRRCIAHS